MRGHSYGVSHAAAHTSFPVCWSVCLIVCLCMLMRARTCVWLCCCVGSGRGGLPACHGDTEVGLKLLSPAVATSVGLQAAQVDAVLLLHASQWSATCIAGNRSVDDDDWAQGAVQYWCVLYVGAARQGQAGSCA